MSKVTTLPSPIDLTTIELFTTGGGSLPVSPAEGWLSTITNCELKENNNKNGGYVEFTHHLMEGEGAGSIGYDKLSVYLPNSPEGEAINRKKLASYGAVCAIPVISDLNMFVGKRVRVIVRLQKGQEAQEKGWTEIAGIKDAAGNNPSRTAPAGAMGATPSPMTTTPAMPVQPVSTPATSTSPFASPVVPAPAAETAVPASPGWAK